MSVKSIAHVIGDTPSSLHRLYDVWNVSPACLPVRSSLYPLTPIGVGTHLVEGLASYISRLAVEHGVFVATLLAHIFRSRGTDVQTLQKTASEYARRSQHLMVAMIGRGR